MKTPIPYLATALLMSGTSSLTICVLVVAESPNIAYDLASKHLVPPKTGFAAGTKEQSHVAARSLVALPAQAFDTIFLSSALPVLTVEAGPHVRRHKVLEAAYGLRANQTEGGSQLPGGEDLEVLLSNFLRVANIELTKAEVLATLALLGQPEPTAA